MSLWINVAEVSAVLLLDGWHEVNRGTFNTDAYEFHEDERVVVGGGTVPGVPHTGAFWVEGKGADRTVVYCPLTSVLAVKQWVPVDSGGSRLRIDPVAGLDNDSARNQLIQDTPEGSGRAVE